MTDPHQSLPIEIRNRWTNDVLYLSAKAKTLREAVIEAVASGASLSRADLSRADLRGADLRDADLSDADLGGADLSGVNLSRAKNDEVGE